jgi:DNA-binding beta-propeller fold protein YncE
MAAPLRGDVVALPGSRFAAALGFPDNASVTLIDLADRRIHGTVSIPDASPVLRAARPSGSARLFVLYAKDSPTFAAIAEVSPETRTIPRARDYGPALASGSLRALAFDPARRRLYISATSTTTQPEGIAAVNAQTLDLIDLDTATAIDRVTLTNAHFSGSFQFPGDVAFDPARDVLVVANGGSRSLTFVDGALFDSVHDSGAPPAPALPRVDVGGTPVAVDVDPDLGVAVTTVKGIGTPAAHFLVAVDITTRTVLYSWDITFWGEPASYEISVLPGDGLVLLSTIGGNQPGVRLFDWTTGNMERETVDIPGGSWIDIAPDYGVAIGVDRVARSFVGFCLER